MNIDIDRKAGASTTVDDHDSFKWVVDFESEIYDKPIGAKTKGFVSLLTLNNGELLARSLSKNQLLIRKGLNGVPQLFGTVATKIGVDIVLDRPKSKAVFKNGNKVVFEADSQSRFQMVVER